MKIDFDIPQSVRDELTGAQIEALEAVYRYGNPNAAGGAIGKNPSSFTRLYKRAQKVCTRLGWSPEHSLVNPIAPGNKLARHSQYYDADGVPTNRWVIQTPDDRQKEAVLLAAAEAMAEDLPDIPVSKGPTKKGLDADIIPWINIGDAHIGMVAHEAETGANFDLKIAERELCKAVAILLEETGNHERCVINDLGDATHYENFAGITEAGGHALDYDGRFPKMIKTYIRIMRFIIEKALQKFKQVDVIVNQGNHSRTNDIWMAEYIRGVYGHSDRVNVLNNDTVFIGYRMGNTFVLSHHSDKCKPDRLAEVMSTDFRQDWGETEYHYIDIGHIHHKMTSKEHPGVMIESFNILANKDLYAHDNGYRSRQSITVIDRSRSWGELGRRLLPVEKVRRALQHETGSGVYMPPEKRAYTV